MIMRMTRDLNRGKKKKNKLTTLAVNTTGWMLLNKHPSEKQGHKHPTGKTVGHFFSTVPFKRH